MYQTICVNITTNAAAEIFCLAQHAFILLVISQLLRLKVVRI